MPDQARIDAIERVVQEAIRDNAATLVNDLGDIRFLIDLWLDHAPDAMALLMRLREYAHGTQVSGARVEREMGALRRIADRQRLERDRLGREMRQGAEQREDQERIRRLPTVDDVIERFNERFVHVIDEPHSIVLDMQSLQKMRPGAFMDAYNRPCRQGDRVIGEGAAWYANPRRNTAFRGIVCDPEKAGGIVQASGHPENVFNTWKGLAVTPRQGDWSMTREMLHKGLCNGSDVSFEHLLSDLARKVQHPGLHAETSTVLLGAHGAGKGTLARILMHFFGPRHCMITQHKGALIGDFNEHLRDLCALVADEAFFVGERGSFSVLRGIISERWLPIHVKRGARFTVPSHLWVLIFSNDEHVLQTLGDRRRFHVLKVAQWHHNDDAYWTALNHELDHGGFEAMLHDLLARDISGFRHRYPPITAALTDQEEYSRRDSLDAWMLDCLMRGYFYESELGLVAHLHVWPEFVSMPMLAKGYRQWAGRHRISHWAYKSDAEIGKYFTSTLKLQARQLRKAIIGELRDKDGPILVRDRARGFVLKDLSTMRAEYDARLQLVNVWEDPEEPMSPVPPEPGSTVTKKPPDYSEEPDEE